MKWGGEQQSTQGFTIVETMIVLAVTGAMFVVAALAISGRQNRTDFQIGSRNLQIAIQGVINETSSGYYPNNGDFTCSAGSGHNVKITSSGSGSAQGQSTNCVFGGKVLAFARNTADYSTYSLAGRRVTTTGQEVTSASDAWLTAIQQSTVSAKLPNAIQYYGVRYSSSGSFSNESVVVPFLSSFGSAYTTSDGQTAGSQSIGLYGYSNIPTFTSSDAAASFIDNEVTYPPNTTGVWLCFSSGTTNQSVIISISPGLSVESQTKNGTTCS